MKARTEKSSRSWHYDLLRIIAMLCVLLFHYTTQFTASVQETRFAVFFPQAMANFAVSLFLLMNGFFSYKSVQNTDLSAVRYLEKRAVRLLPTFWLCLCITSLVLTLTHTTVISFKQFVLNLFLINRFVNVPFVDGAYWYMLIVVEFAVFIAVVKKCGGRKARKVLYGLYTAGFLTVGFVNRYVYHVPTVISFALFEYFNKCLAGLVIGYLFFEGKKLSVRDKLESAFVIVVLMAGEFLWIGSAKAAVEIASVILFCAVVFLLGKIKVGSDVSGALGKAAGETYFVYLIHQQVGFVIIKSLIDRGTNCNIAVLLTVLVIVLLSFAHHYLSWQTRSIPKSQH